jgi:hypothetical protein
MSKTTRFLATCLLVTSMSAVAFAEGGDTQGPPHASPPPASAESTARESGYESLATAPDSSIDVVTTATVMFAIWLEAAIF